MPYTCAYRYAYASIDIVSKMHPFFLWCDFVFFGATFFLLYLFCSPLFDLLRVQTRAVEQGASTIAAESLNDLEKASILFSRY